MVGRGKRGRHARRGKVDATPPWADASAADKPAGPATTGPWDVEDVPGDGVERIDLGALRIPVAAGVDLRVEVGADGQVVSATLSHAGSELQVGVFAAPRTAGIWAEVRKEILASLAAQGGTGQDGRGEFGPEISGRIPVRGGYQVARFVGVDGPRWFLRGMYVGTAAADPQQSRALTDIFRQIVVVRGTDPMPVREPLPLRLPQGLAEQAAAQQGATDQAGAERRDGATAPQS